MKRGVHELLVLLGKDALLRAIVGGSAGIHGSLV